LVWGGEVSSTEFGVGDRPIGGLFCLRDVFDFLWVLTVMVMSPWIEAIEDAEAPGFKAAAEALGVDAAKV